MYKDPSGRRISPINPTLPTKLHNGFVVSFSKLNHKMILKDPKVRNSIYLWRKKLKKCNDFLSPAVENKWQMALSPRDHGYQEILYETRSCSYFQQSLLSIYI